MSFATLARKEAFNTVAETCPEVDAALADAERRIKDCTTELRDALIAAIEARMEAEDRAESLADELHSLRDDYEQLLAETEG